MKPLNEMRNWTILSPNKSPAGTESVKLAAAPIPAPASLLVSTHITGEDPLSPPHQPQGPCSSVSNPVTFPIRANYAIEFNAKWYLCPNKPVRTELYLCLESQD